VNLVVLYLLLVKATLTSFSGLASLPVIRGDFVLRYHMLTDRQLNTAVAARDPWVSTWSASATSPAEFPEPAPAGSP